jgi:Transcriptional regulators
VTDSPPAAGAAATAADLRGKEEEVRSLVRQFAGQRLPGERDLAARLQISRPRLRAILATLRREGLVEQRQGSGTFAVAPAGSAGGVGRLRRAALLVDENLKLGDDPFFSLLLELLQRQLQQEGVRCVVERVTGEETAPHFEEGALTLGLAGAALLARHRGGTNAPPLVTLFPEPDARPHRRASLLGVDDREAGREAARALIRRGCGSLLFLGKEEIPASRERLAGAREAAEAEGVSLRFLPSGLSHGAGLRTGRSLALDADGTTGLIATNDWLAVGLRAGLADRHGARAATVPLVSFDGLPLAADPGLHIRSLTLPVEAIAADAVAELLRLHASPVSVGRAVRYPFAWRSDAL